MARPFADRLVFWVIRRTGRFDFAIFLLVPVFYFSSGHGALAQSKEPPTVKRIIRE